jgi:hypothetical protein
MPFRKRPRQSTNTPMRNHRLSLPDLFGALSRSSISTLPESMYCDRG